MIESPVDLRGVRVQGTHEAVYLPDAAGNAVKRAADRPREARPSCTAGLGYAGPKQRVQVEGGLRDRDRCARVVDVGTQQ